MIKFLKAVFCLDSKRRIMVASSVLLLLTGCFWNRQSQYANKPAVKVGELELTTKELARKLTASLKSHDFVSARDPNVVRQTKESIIKDFIVESLVATWADKNEIQVSDAEIDAEVVRIRQDYPDDLTFREELNEAEISFAEWKRTLKFTLLQRKVFQKLNEGTEQPTEEEIKTYYQNNKKEFVIPDRIKIKQIVLSKKDNAELIYGELKKGGDFDALLKKYSISPSAKYPDASEWIEKGSLPIFDKAFNAPAGRLSSIEQSPFGFHIYKVLERQVGATIPFEKAADRIKALLMTNREQARFTSWLDEQLRQVAILRDDAIIDGITVETRRSEN